MKRKHVIFSLAVSYRVTWLNFLQLVAYCWPASVIYRIAFFILVPLLVLVLVMIRFF